MVSHGARCVRPATMVSDMHLTELDHRPLIVATVTPLTDDGATLGE